MIEEIGFWVLYFIVLSIPLLYRLFIKDWDFDYEKEIENLTRQVKCYSELFLDEATVCEYCGTKGEVGDQYCHLCGTGLKK